MISPLSFVHPDAKLADTVEVGPFVFIDKDVEIGEGTVIDANATICEHTRIGKHCHIFPSAVVGAVPQDLKFQGELTYTFIGDHTVLRECSTVHRGTASKGKTVVGSHCLIMAYCHVAHDVVVKDHVVMSNATQLAGEVVVDEYAVLGGGTLVHQFTHIGSYVMTQGGSKISKDIPPFCMVARDPIQYSGVNSIGLNRHGFTHEQINAIQDIYRIIYGPTYNVSQAVEHVINDLPESKEKTMVVDFIKSSQKGIVRGSF